MEEAITSPHLNLGEVCMLVRINGDTTIDELNYAESFYLIEEEEEEEEEDDQDRRIRELHEKGRRLKEKLEELEQRDKVIMDTARTIDESIKNSLIESDYFQEEKEDLPEFNEELAEELTEEPEPVPEEPKEETKKKKTGSKYDLPKIQALLNAGWTNEQLAVEFGVSKETISKNLYYWRKAGKIK
jgi:hypothetical protein